MTPAAHLFVVLTGYIVVLTEYMGIPHPPDIFNAMQQDRVSIHRRLDNI